MFMTYQYKPRLRGDRAASLSYNQLHNSKHAVAKNSLILRKLFIYPIDVIVGRLWK